MSPKELFIQYLTLIQTIWHCVLESFDFIHWTMDNYLPFRRIVSRIDLFTLGALIINSKWTIHSCSNLQVPAIRASFPVQLQFVIGVILVNKKGNGRSAGKWRNGKRRKLSIRYASNPDPSGDLRSTSLTCLAHLASQTWRVTLLFKYRIFMQQWGDKWGPVGVHESATRRLLNGGFPEGPKLNLICF